MEILSMADRRSAIAAATAALDGVTAVLHTAAGSDLGPIFGELDELFRRLDAARVGVLGEALARGEVAASDCPSATAWVLEWAPSYRSGGAAQLVRVTQASAAVRNAGLAAAVLGARIGIRNAAVALAEMDKLRPRLTEEAVETVWDGFIQIATDHGPREIRALRDRIIATYGHLGEFQRRADQLRQGVSLSQPHEDDGMFDYTLRLDPEGRTALEAMLGPLSAPCPTAEVSDLRTSDQRRGDALVEICRRAAAAGGDAPATTKAQVFVTMDYEQLRTACGAGTDLLSGQLLAPETVRRIACDASIIPVVLGGKGEILELGRTKRLFSPGLMKALWLRDKGCTIPGCTAPPHWADGHHVIHWADGGPTDLPNAALLCPRHHTLAHQRGWTATVTAFGVTWHI